MKGRPALVLATLGTGCIITDSDGGSYGYGDLNLYWEFVARRRTSRPCCTTRSIPPRREPARAWTPAWTRSASPFRTARTWTGLPVSGRAGRDVQAFRRELPGPRDGYRGATALYDSDVTVSVPDGSVGSATAQCTGSVEPRRLRAFHEPERDRGVHDVCAGGGGGVHLLARRLGGHGGRERYRRLHRPAGASFRGGQALDRDLYAVRMQGFVSPRRRRRTSTRPRP